MANHLILGGAGFVARHVALLLDRAGERVKLVARKPSPALHALIARGLSVELGDIRSADWSTLLKGVDVVHHYAWSTVPSTADRDPLGDVDENVKSTIRLLEALRARGGGRIVFASSGGTVYGTLRQVPASEDHPREPISIYGASKVAVEHYLSVYRQQYKVDARIARISNPFGVGQSLNGNQGAATLFLHRSIDNQPIQLFGDGSVVRDYIHIADLADAMQALASVELPASAPFIFNVGTGIGVSLNEILEVLEGGLGRPLLVERLAGRAYDVPVSVLDPSRAKQHLGWAPRLSFADGIHRAIADIRNGMTFLSTLNDGPTA